MGVSPLQLLQTDFNEFVWSMADNETDTGIQICVYTGAASTLPNGANDNGKFANLCLLFHRAEQIIYLNESAIATVNWQPLINYTQITNNLNYTTITNNLDYTIVSNNLDYTIVSNNLDYTIVSNNLDYTIVSNNLDYTIVSNNLDYTIVSNNLDYTIVSNNLDYTIVSQNIDIDAMFKAEFGSPIANDRAVVWDATTQTIRLAELSSLSYDTLTNILTATATGGGGIVQSLEFGETISQYDAIVYNDGNMKIFQNFSSTSLSSDKINNTNVWLAQTFTTDANVTSIDSIALELDKTGSPTGTYTFRLQALSGGFPDGVDIATATINVANISSSGSVYRMNFSPNTVSGGTQYAIVFDPSGLTVDGSNNFDISYKSTGGYSGGQRQTSADGSSWSGTSSDFCFEIAQTYGEAGKVYLAGRRTTPTPKPMIALAAGVATDTRNVQKTGTVSGVSLTANSRYYVDTSNPGNITTTPDGPFVGYTTTDTTKLILDAPVAYEPPTAVTADFAEEGGVTDPTVNKINLPTSALSASKASGMLTFAVQGLSAVLRVRVSQSPFDSAAVNNTTVGPDDTVAYISNDATNDDGMSVTVPVQAGDYVSYSDSGPQNVVKTFRRDLR